MICFSSLNETSSQRQGGDAVIMLSPVDTTALTDLLRVDDRHAQDDTLHRSLDGLLGHKDARLAHLRGRWSDLFGAKFDALLYGPTSTYFECDVPADYTSPRRFGYSRAKRSDCVQVIVALVVAPARLPLAYEMIPDNTVQDRAAWQAGSYSKR